MDFSLTKQEELFLQMIREFAENEVKPLAAEIDDQERFPLETVEKMSKIGLMGIPVPKEYGGQGGTNQMYTMAVEELSRVCATTGVVLSAHTSLCIAPIMENGTEEQKQKYVPRLASGEWIGAFGLTEPNAGTDAAMQQTTAVEDGDSYILNGSKIFITNAGYAPMFEKETKDNKYHNNPYRIINFKRDEAGNLICPNGKRFIHKFDKHIRGNKYGRTEEIYECEDCTNCPYKKECCKRAKGNRTARLNRELTAIHHEVIDNLESIHGALLRMNRSIQAEGTFGTIKWNRTYKRLFRRGEKAVLLEFTLISCGFNLYKYHNKKTRQIRAA